MSSDRPADDPLLKPQWHKDAAQYLLTPLGTVERAIIRADQNWIRLRVPKLKAHLVTKPLRRLAALAEKLMGETAALPFDFEPETGAVILEASTAGGWRVPVLLAGTEMKLPARRVRAGTKAKIKVLAVPAYSVEHGAFIRLLLHDVRLFEYEDKKSRKAPPRPKRRSKKTKH